MKFLHSKMKTRCKSKNKMKSTLEFFTKKKKSKTLNLKNLNWHNSMVVLLKSKNKIKINMIIWTQIFQIILKRFHKIETNSSMDLRCTLHTVLLTQWAIILPPQGWLQLISVRPLFSWTVSLKIWLVSKNILTIPKLIKTTDRWSKGNLFNYHLYYF